MPKLVFEDVVGPATVNLPAPVEGTHTPANLLPAVNGIPGTVSPHPAENTVDVILSLIGPAVLLDWQRGTKGSRRKWGHLTLAAQTDDRLAFLRRHVDNGGNLGVILGDVSGGLCTVDLDDESDADTFLASNPKLTGSLRTVGARGCQVWMRMAGPFPASGHAKHRETGRVAAEWRAVGCQSIIHGRHKEGMDYRRVVDAPPILIEFDEIVWPPTWETPFKDKEKRSAKQHTGEWSSPVW